MIKEKIFEVFVFKVFFVLGMLTHVHLFRKGTIHMNDYLNPFTITFKNPKTVEMLNIIILYHYVMSYLIAIVIFTFIFIILSFFRTYPLFYIKPSAKEYLVEGWPGLTRVLNFRKSFEDNLLNYKFEFFEFYKEDMKRAIKDQVTHAPVLEFLWVVFPALILAFIAYPSVMMLYYNEAYVTPVYNITAVGNQWY